MFTSRHGIVLNVGACLSSMECCSCGQNFRSRRALTPCRPFSVFGFFCCWVYLGFVRASYDEDPGCSAFAEKGCILPKARGIEG